VSFVAPYIRSLDIADNAINERFLAATNSVQALSAGVTTTVETVVCSHGAGANLVDIMGVLRNTSGGTRTMDVTIEDGGGALYSFPNITLADNGMMSFPAAVAVPAGVSTTYRLRVNMATAGSVNNTKLIAEARRR
jgi:hypothetical protein